MLLNLQKPENARLGMFLHEYLVSSTIARKNTSTKFLELKISSDKCVFFVSLLGIEILIPQNRVQNLLKGRF